MSYPVRWRKNIFRWAEKREVHHFCTEGGRIRKEWSLNFLLNHTLEIYLSPILLGRKLPCFEKKQASFLRVHCRGRILRALLVRSDMWCSVKGEAHTIKENRKTGLARVSILIGSCRYFVSIQTLWSDCLCILLRRENLMQNLPWGKHCPSYSSFECRVSQIVSAKVSNWQISSIVAERPTVIF